MDENRDIDEAPERGMRQAFLFVTAFVLVTGGGLAFGLKALIEWLHD